MTPDRSPSLDRTRGIYRGWYIAGVSALSIGAVLGTAQFAFSLLNNAGRFTNKGGVHIQALCQEGQIVVSVTDTGPGIA